MVGQTLQIPLNNIEITQFKSALTKGELVVVPTDTVYGIGANPKQASAVDRLLTAKGRGREYPSPVLAADFLQVKELVSELPLVAKDLAEAFWPGALTMVLPAKPDLGWDLGITQGTVAVRIPNHCHLQELLKICGPLAVTSANLHGEPAATSCRQAQDYFGNRVAIYVDGGERANNALASTIIKPLCTVLGAAKHYQTESSDTIEFEDRSGLVWQVLRQGAIAWTDLAAVAGSSSLG